MAIFQKSVIKKHLRTLNTTWLNIAYDKFKEIFNPEKIETIKNLKEEEYQDGFLRDLFVQVLGYTLKPDKNFDLVREFKNQTDGKKSRRSNCEKHNKGTCPLGSYRTEINKNKRPYKYYTTGI